MANRPENREVVDMLTLLLASPVVTVSLPNPPLNPVDLRSVRGLLEQAVTMEDCKAALRPIIGDMKFEYEASVRGAELPGNA